VKAITKSVLFTAILVVIPFAIFFYAISDGRRPPAPLTVEADWSSQTNDWGGGMIEDEPMFFTDIQPSPTNYPPTVEWQGGLVVNRRECWLELQGVAGYEIGLRADGVVVWRRKP
jgi:hypothetical protein